MNPRYPLVAKRAAHRCEYCYAPEAIFNFPFEVEHIIPPAREGADDETNWALACRHCNLRKHNHIEAIDSETHAPVVLFHPRRDRWGDHFQVHMETGAIRGRTPVGRATIVRLEMNSATQLAARRRWIALGLFP